METYTQVSFSGVTMVNASREIDGKRDIEKY